MGFVRVLVGGAMADVTAGEEDALAGQSEAEVMVDRLAVGEGTAERLTEAVETCYRLGKGRCRVHVVDQPGIGASMTEYTRALRCTDCNREMPDPSPALFSFNSPIGACETCSALRARPAGIETPNPLE